MTTNATLTRTEIAELRAAQDEAAQLYWAYPDAQWQEDFQQHWLWETKGVLAATCPNGFYWGKEE